MPARVSPTPIAVAVAAVVSIVRSLPVNGAAAFVHFELHESIGNVAEEFADNIVLSPLFNELGE